ncbi:MAG: hypothetical protein F6K26_32490 [Moorea sp. SIO2I5]|nr:hypothetical protein [Moorena sp. SIO2I5]
MAFSFYKKPQINNDYRDLNEEKLFEESLRQAKYSYNLAFAVTAASALMILCGVGLFYSNKVSEEKLTASGVVLGIIPSVKSFKFAKDSKEELEEMRKKFLDKS